MSPSPNMGAFMRISSGLVGLVVCSLLFTQGVRGEHYTPIKDVVVQFLDHFAVLSNKDINVTWDCYDMVITPGKEACGYKPLGPGLKLANGSINGGVQMGLDRSFDLAGAAGIPSDGSTHYKWYFPFAIFVEYCQKSGGCSEFESIDRKHLGNPVGFHNVRNCTDITTC